MSEVRKSEVHALQYAVCLFLSVLDRILFGQLVGWKPNFSGAKMDIYEKNAPQDILVRIRPAKWPNGSFIEARFTGSERGGWSFWEGRVDARHVQLPSNGGSFYVDFRMSHSVFWDICGFDIRGSNPPTPSESLFVAALTKAGFHLDT